MGEARRRSTTLTPQHESDLITSAETLTAITFYHFTNAINFIGVEGVAELARCAREGGAPKIVGAGSILDVGLTPASDLKDEWHTHIPLPPCIWLTDHPADRPGMRWILRRDRELRLTLSIPRFDRRLWRWRDFLHSYFTGTYTKRKYRFQEDNNVFVFFGQILPHRIRAAEPVKPLTEEDWAAREAVFYAGLGGPGAS
jgi:hypothetical protein